VNRLTRAWYEARLLRQYGCRTPNAATRVNQSGNGI